MINDNDEDEGLFPLRVQRVRSNGKREYDERSKERLVKRCLQGRQSTASLALKAGVNANQLRKWVVQYRQSLTPGDAERARFVPVVTHRESAAPPVMARRPVTESTLCAKLPGDITLELHGASHDPELVRALVGALLGRL